MMSTFQGYLIRDTRSDPVTTNRLAASPESSGNGARYCMVIGSRFVAAAALVAALAAAGPIADANAAPAPEAVASGGASTSAIPCYPFPAWCGPDGQPVPFAPWWVRPALGLPPSPVWPP